MGPFIEEWLGEQRPKQYCTFVGSRSMLRHSWDRARALALPDRVVTVLGHGHRRFPDDAREPAPGPLLEQPCDCGTARGVFLGATLVAARDPAATVVVMPADHFVHPEGRFLALVETACRQAAVLPGRLVLLGARAHRRETDFGWIVPGPRALAFPALRVEGFEEKPTASAPNGCLPAAASGAR
jgi:mannose-1-phosphate guanylyltransferase